MIAGIVLGSLALLAALALYQRIWIKVVWGPDRRSFDVRYLFLSFRGPRRRREGEEKKRRVREKARRGRGDALGWLKLAPKLLRAGGKGLRFLLQHSELLHLRIEGSVGTEDPATTGILWGTIQTVNSRLGPSSKIQLAVTPDFDEGETHLKANAEGSVRLWVLVATVVVVLWHLPKRKLWRLLREQRRRRKASRRAGLKANPNPKKEVEAA